MPQLYANILTVSADSEQELQEFLDAVRLGSCPFCLQKIYPMPLSLRGLQPNESALLFAKLRKAKYGYVFKRYRTVSPKLAKALGIQTNLTLHPRALDNLERRCHTYFGSQGLFSLCAVLRVDSHTYAFSPFSLQREVLKRSSLIEQMSEEELKDFITVGDRLLFCERFFEVCSEDTWKEKYWGTPKECLYVDVVREGPKEVRFRMVTEKSSLSQILLYLYPCFPYLNFYFVGVAKDDPSTFQEEGCANEKQTVCFTSADEKIVVAEEIWEEVGPTMISQNRVSATQLSKTRSPRDAAYVRMLSEKYINEHADDLDWAVLLLTQPLSEAVFLRYLDRFDWSVVVTRHDLPEKVLESAWPLFSKKDKDSVAMFQWLSVRTIFSHYKEMDPQVLMSRQSLPEEIAEQFFESCFASSVLCQPLSEKFLLEKSAKIDPNVLVCCQLLSEGFLLKHIHSNYPKYLWLLASRYQRLSFSLLEKHKDEVSWDHVAQSQELTLREVYAFGDYLDPDLLREYQDLPVYFRQSKNT